MTAATGSMGSMMVRGIRVLFSMRALIVVLSLCCVAIVVLRCMSHEAERQREIVRDLHRHGFSVLGPEEQSLLPVWVDIAHCRRLKVHARCDSPDLDALKPLARLGPETLDLSYTTADLTPLSEMDCVKVINISGSAVTDLSPLAEMESLEAVILVGAGRQRPAYGGDRLDWHAIPKLDLAPLVECPHLKRLALDHANLEDITPLGRCRYLEDLRLGGTYVSDIAPLAGCKNLTTLGISDTPVSDISALRSCSRLETLDLSRTRISDLSALAECRNLRELDLSYQQVGDMSPLGNCSQLETLRLVGSCRINLRDLANCRNLRELDLSYSDVSDIRSLSSCPRLTRLHLADTYVGDLNYRVPLDLYDNYSDLSTLMTMDQLEYVDVSLTLSTPEHVDELQQALPNCKIRR